MNFYHFVKNNKMSNVLTQVKTLQEQKSALIQNDCEILCKGAEFTENDREYCCIHEKQLIDTEIQIEKLMNDNPQIYSTPEQIVEINRLVDKFFNKK
jgi:hypothetical protein